MTTSGAAPSHKGRGHIDAQRCNPTGCASQAFSRKQISFSHLRGGRISLRAAD
jgi:hypothetical protein